MNKYESWGRYPKIDQTAIELHWEQDAIKPLHNAKVGSILAYGNGRSYGDSCISCSHTVIASRGLDRFILFDSEKGILRCECGVLLSEILNFVIPHGWFLPVVPGTKYITLGGAVANDIHGKNHHTAGTFGCHVLQFELLRSNGSRLLCSPSENAGYFCATIGGLGLTGLILWVELQLKRICNDTIEMETIRYGHLSEFFELSRKSDGEYEYTVAWLDCLAKKKQLGRGHFIRGNHANVTKKLSHSSKNIIKIPNNLPISLVNSISARIFNTIHYNLKANCRKPTLVRFDPFFFPLDRIKHWNRIYGRNGFQQYQCVIPSGIDEDTICEILTCISRAKIGSFLAVLKVFGKVHSPGILSFPISGTTLAVDFPNIGYRTNALFNDLDKLVFAAGGRLYPAKDAHVSANHFQTGYPDWKKLLKYKDPVFCSMFWDRISGEC